MRATLALLAAAPLTSAQPVPNVSCSPDHAPAPAVEAGCSWTCGGHVPLTCGAGQYMRGACGGGERSDCHGPCHGEEAIYCCDDALAGDPYDTTWYPVEDFGESYTCTIGSATGVCESGGRPVDCLDVPFDNRPESVAFGVRCGGALFDDSACTWRCGGKGAFLACAAGEAVVGKCGSGRYGSCSDAGTVCESCGEGAAYHAVLCCGLSDAPTPPAPPATPAPAPGPRPVTPAPPPPSAGKYIWGVPCTAGDPTQVGWSYETADWSTGQGVLRYGGQCVEYLEKVPRHQPHLLVSGDCARGPATEFIWMGAPAGAADRTPIYPFLYHTGQKQCIDVYQHHGPKVVLHKCTDKYNEAFTFNANGTLSTGEGVCLAVRSTPPDKLAGMGGLMQPRDEVEPADNGTRLGGGPLSKEHPGWSWPGNTRSCLIDPRNRSRSLVHKGGDVCRTVNHGGTGGDLFCTREFPAPHEQLCGVQAYWDNGTRSHGMGGIRVHWCGAPLPTALVAGMYSFPYELYTSPFYGLFTRSEDEVRWEDGHYEWFNTTKGVPFTRVYGRSGEMIHMLWLFTAEGRSHMWGNTTAMKKPLLPKHDHFPFNHSLGDGLVGIAGTAGNRLNQIYFKHACPHVPVPTPPKPTFPKNEVVYAAEVQDCGSMGSFQSWTQPSAGGGSIALREMLHPVTKGPLCLTDAQNFTGKKGPRVAVAACDGVDHGAQFWTQLQPPKCGGLQLRNGASGECLVYHKGKMGMGKCEDKAEACWFHDSYAYPVDLLRTMVIDKKSEAAAPEKDGVRQCLSAVPQYNGVALPGVPPVPSWKRDFICDPVPKFLPFIPLFTKQPYGPRRNCHGVPFGCISINVSDLTVQLPFIRNFSRCALYDPLQPISLSAGKVTLAFGTGPVPWQLDNMHGFHGPFGAHLTMQGEGYCSSEIAITIDYSLVKPRHIACGGFNMGLSHLGMHLFGGGAWGAVAVHLESYINKEVQKGIPALAEKVFDKYCSSKQSCLDAATGPQGNLSAMVSCTLQGVIDAALSDAPGTTWPPTPAPSTFL